jgi:hypothetical protein
MPTRPAARLARRPPRWHWRNGPPACCDTSL